MDFLRIFISGMAFLSYVSAGFPSQPNGIRTTSLPTGASISYKETFICETKSKAWAGYVHLPSSLTRDIQPSDPYNISMFFWYFEAHNKPEHAQTAIYLAGGPGDSSMFGATQDGGPCVVLQDSNSTAPNPFSWNRNVNMLYVDQPVGSGYSYDEIIQSTHNLLFAGTPLTETGITPFEAYNGTIPPQNTTFLYGNFPSQRPDRTANSTAVAARTMWHFSQAWFKSFPEYRTSNKKISLWGNSYGGYWTSGTGAFFQKQNDRIRSGKLNDSMILELDTIGMTNGCLDMLFQGGFYPQMAYNNTYGLEVIPKDVYEEAAFNFTKPGGCRDQVMKCRDLGDLHDPEQLSLDDTVNDACVNATIYCSEFVLGAYDALSNVSVTAHVETQSKLTTGFSGVTLTWRKSTAREQQNLMIDLILRTNRHMKPDPFPPAYATGFFNQHWVQQALGSPINFTSGQ